MRSTAPSAAVSPGRFSNATETGSRKNTGNSHAVAPPDDRHSVTTARTSISVDTQPAQSGTVPRRTTSSQTSDATKYPMIALW